MLCCSCNTSERLLFPLPTHQNYITNILLFNNTVSYPYSWNMTYSLIFPQVSWVIVFVLLDVFIYV